MRKITLRDPSDSAVLAAARARWPVVVAGLMILGGLALWRDPRLNEAWFHDVNGLGPAAPVFWSSLTVAGLALAAWIYLGAFAQRNPQRIARLLWIVVVGGLVNHFIKHALANPRPLLALGAEHLNVIGERLQTQSMPSGHSAMAFAMAGLMLMEQRERAALASTRDRRGFLLLAGASWLLLALGIALSRLAVGAHWPADALFGGGLGLLFASLSAHAWPVDALTRLVARPLGARLVAAGMGVSALSIAATPSVTAALGLAHSTLEKKLATGYPQAQVMQWALALVALVGAVRWWRAAKPGASATA